MELQLLFLGVVLLLVEGFIPGFGIFGISGILCLLGALYFFLGARPRRLLWWAVSCWCWRSWGSG